MHISKDIVDFIVDQLVLASGEDHRQCLQTASLVSTVWVDRSQHHLFSTIAFSHRESVEEWCSVIRPGPDGISRHVRVLSLDRGEYDSSPLATSVLKAAFHHLTSFRGLQGLEVFYVDFDFTSFDLLISIISSFAGTLERLLWTQTPDTVHETWTTISTLTNLLPNLKDLLLSSPAFSDTNQITSPPLPRIQLPDEEPERINPHVFKYFKFQELRVGGFVPQSPSLFEYCRTHLRALDLRDMTMFLYGDQNRRALPMLLEACRTLEMFAFIFGNGVGRLLGSVSSDSISLIQLHYPRPIIPTGIFNGSRSWDIKVFERYIHDLEEETIPECRELGASLRKAARRFCDHNPGLKTRVQIISHLTPTEAQAIENIDIPFFQAELEILRRRWGIM